MGHSQWSDDAYTDRQSDRRASGKTAFTYDAHVRASGQVRIHPQMDPFFANRESRDSAEHPESLAIAVMFDVTGSMGSVPRVLQTKLGSLMRVLVEKVHIDHPQVLFGAVGDAYCDAVPLQIGQFESGLEMDDDLGKLYIEGGGGGQVHESYELAMYMIARHTAIDCFEKRGKKGYLFTIGDEKPYKAIRADQVRKHIGDPLERDLPTPALVKELLDRYEYFHIVPTNTSHGRNPEIHDTWRKLLGERVLLLEDEGAVCETIAMAVGLNEGSLDSLDDIADEMIGAGYDRHAVTTATVALAPLNNRRSNRSRGFGFGRGRF